MYPPDPVIVGHEYETVLLLSKNLSRTAANFKGGVGGC